MAVNEEIRNQLPEDAIVLDNCSYDNSIIGVTLDNRVIYDFDKMVDELIEDGNAQDEIEAIEWIECNTLRALPYAGSRSPIVVNNLYSEYVENLDI